MLQYLPRILAQIVFKVKESIKWIWQIRKRWSLHKTNNLVNINYIHTYRELSYSQNDLITAARARLSLGLDTVVAGRVTV